jgi:hypothetical protein
MYRAKIQAETNEELERDRNVLTHIAAISAEKPVNTEPTLFEN